jgi:hypothetical protein
VDVAVVSLNMSIDANAQVRALRALALCAGHFHVEAVQEVKFENLPCD